jgi:hypothetical protein
VKLSVAFFSSIGLSGTREADAGRSTPTYYISIDAVWPKDVPCGVPTLINYIFGEVAELFLFSMWECGDLYSVDRSTAGVRDRELT